MNDQDEPSEGLLALMDELLSGAIAPERMAALQRALDGNPATQKLLFDYCQLHVDLEQDVRTQRIVDRFRQDQLAARAAPAVTATGVMGSIARHIGQYLPGGSNAVPLLAAVAVVLLACLVAVPVLRQFDEPRPVVQAGLDLAAPSRAPALTSVKIDSGATTLALDKIGSVVVEGPADFELLSPTRARLNTGRIKVHITEKTGLGFVVETPHGEVTDLGTEFGLDVARDTKTGLVVFQGAVDLRVPAANHRGADARVERLVEGEGMVVAKGGQLARLMSIVTGDAATFQQCGESRSGDLLPVISDVADDMREADTKNFYEIVPGGLREGARAYVDRPKYDWRWVKIDQRGLPDYLVGADYVKPFNNDKMRRTATIDVTVSRPARLFVIFDDRIKAPDWLVRGFRDTGDDVGIDVGPSAYSDVIKWHDDLRKQGKRGAVYTKFSVWERMVGAPGKVTLGPNAGGNLDTAMYGIAAAALEEEESTQDD